NERALAVQQLGNRCDLIVEDSERVGVGDHEHGRALVELRPQIVQIDDTSVIAFDADGVEAGYGGAGWVGAVRTIRNEDARTLYAAILEIGGGDQERRQLAVSTGGRL